MDPFQIWRETVARNPDNRYALDKMLAVATGNDPSENVDFQTVRNLLNRRPR